MIALFDTREIEHKPKIRWPIFAHWVLNNREATLRHLAHDISEHVVRKVTRFPHETENDWQGRIAQQHSTTPRLGVAYF
jgi:hypothetical protein